MSFLETLGAAFKGSAPAERPPLARPFASPWLFADGGIGALPYEYRGAVGRAYLDNPVAQRAVRMVAEGVASAPLKPCDPDLVKLVTATSAGQSLLETLAAQVLLHGNGYIQIIKDASGKPVELFALRPERISVDPGPDGWPAAYRYRVGESVITLPIEDDAQYPNIVHIKGFHPGDDHYGAGCLSAANESVAIHNAAARWNRVLLENAARPSGALVYEAGDGATLTNDQFERLKAELATAFQGSGNAGRPMLLEGGLKWQSLSMSPADMDFATLKSAAARDIALAFGVPPMLLGLPGDNTYSNYREANRALWRLTLLPLAGKILSALTEGLAIWFREANLTVDLDRVPALAEDREKLWSQLSDADFLSDDEKRAMLGLPPRPKPEPETKPEDKPVKVKPKEKRP
ncbi:phage portal protein [Croceicoccus naphthovorans]|uniref:Portal protein n=1 Tax=Croceicoccus naphthovorans TaxID=1348774 RepID=A0A0G3XF71_9SPHN|nr:phage portal protein [Croceicoccus naphthovorans]AKM09291.1 portal protein [Croceicoccus naphthovorans]MBB3990190.1 HK97 family phage portal protein [Croceicoccus naphthovorans]